MSCIASSHTHLPLLGANTSKKLSELQREFSTSCKRCRSPSNLTSAVILDGWQTAVPGLKNGYCPHRSDEQPNIRLKIGEAAYRLGPGWSGSIVPPHRLRYRFLGVLAWGHDYPQNGVSEVSSERSSPVFKSVNAGPNLECRTQTWGGSTGGPKHDVRGQHGRLDAVPLPFNEWTLSPQMDKRRIKVIGAGTGASVILNFCQQSSLLPSAEFWYSSDLASEPIRLSEYTQAPCATTNGSEVENKQDPLTQDSKEEMVFLVLGAGSSNGLGDVPGKLRAARSRGCLAVGIFIQPFMFEGTKRLEQATNLVEALLDCTDLLLVVEQDGLLKREVVTVSEASSIAKNAVLLSIKAISGFLTGKADVGVGTTIQSGTAAIDENRKLQKLKHAGKAWSGFGRGLNFEEAVEKALADCPNLDDDPFGITHVVLCSLAHAVGQGREEMVAAESFLQHALGPGLQLIVTAVENSMLEKDVTLAMIIIIRLNSQQVASSEYSRTMGVDGDNGSSILKQGKRGTQIMRPTNEQNTLPQKRRQQQRNKSLGKKFPIGSNRPSREDLRNVDFWQVPQQSLASSASQKLRLALGWEAGPSSDLAEAWAQARAEAREPTQVTSSLDVSLPVGVRLDDDQLQRVPRENFAFSTGFEVAQDKWIGTEAVPVDPDALPRNRMMDMGFGAVRDMYKVASALVMGKEISEDRIQASLSQRAASMLESERSRKKLTPLVEMAFKNGSYKGRCQGGLPDGKGRLSFADGSFYDGQWKQGRRAGSGAFYYANGDMFQGSWKEDVMHGKGWMYYHNGDRLYANFWKGKADGEGRFYSAQGDVFFGQFVENWRHGDLLYIEASGVRWSEVWENGILKSRTPLDS